MWDCADAHRRHGRRRATRAMYTTDDARRASASLGDDDLLALLQSACRAADPVPEHILEGARWAITWRTVDAELAELAGLVVDSVRERSETPTVS